MQKSLAYATLPWRSRGANLKKLDSDRGPG